MRLCGQCSFKEDFLKINNTYVSMLLLDTNLLEENETLAIWLTWGGSAGSWGAWDEVGKTGELGLDHFLPPSQLAVISMPRTFTEGCSSSCGTFPLATTFYKNISINIKTY